jgi:carboxyl-terminal processing protease
MNITITARLRIVLALLTVVLLGVGFAAGYGVVTYRTARSIDPIVTEVTNQELGKSQAVDFSLFWQVWERLHEKYVDMEALDAQKLVYGAIEGMVAAAGDPYTAFMQPETSKKFQEEVSGEFSGVGMEIGKRDGFVTVIAPIRDSPAMRAGVMAGDIVVKVDGLDTDGWTTEEAVSRIRGKKGTSVVLTLSREGHDGFIELTIVRDVIKIPAVEWKMLDGSIAYVQIISFNANVGDEFAKAARELTAQGARGLIIDVRNNPGGLLDQAVDIAGWMLPSGSIVVQERFGDGLIEQMRAGGNARLAQLPTVFLINGGAASASEILAGAIHDIRGVQLVGEKTFGKGSVQQLEQFYNGASLKVTVAKWLTPNGVNISDDGIDPTVEVLMNPAEFEERGWALGSVGKDPQLDRAVELLK